MTRNGMNRLQVECLEDRTTPATLSVTTTADVIDPADGKLSLREAITRANNRAGTDLIVVPAGVFKIALAGDSEDGNATGDFDITDSLTIQGAGADIAIIDGQQLDRVFDVFGTAPSSIRVVFNGLTVRNGSVTDFSLHVGGGGIRVGNADLVVRDCAVTANQAFGWGGGISNVEAPGTGDVRVVRTTVARNVAGCTGGGIYVADSSLIVNDSTVRRNVGSLGGGGIDATGVTVTNSAVNGNRGSAGGGILAFGATVTNSTVNGNRADLGGGIHAEGVTLTNSEVSGNTATMDGGGVVATFVTLTRSKITGNTAVENGAGISAGISPLTHVTLTNSTVSGNSAGNDGGGIYAFITATLTNCSVSDNTAIQKGGGISGVTMATLTNCTVSSNWAGSNGGGIYFGSNAIKMDLLNCTIVENTANTGGGLFHDGTDTFSLKNTIVALNIVDFAGNGPDVFGAFTSQGHNLIGSSTSATGFTHGNNGDIVGTALDPIDPKLGPLANNGGPTKTHALLGGSRAIDAGDNSDLPPTDQRGLARKKDGTFVGSAVVDIGAFER